MAEISKITLPSGNTYDIKDATAREMISGGVSFIIAWDGASTPVVANIPAGVVVTYGGTTYTGTMSADGAQAGAFYLVRSSTQTEVLDVYDEYVPVGTTGSKTWEKIGDTQVSLADVVTGVALNKQTTAVVTGFANPTTDSVIGADATMSMTQPTINVTPSTTYLGATASGTAVGADGTASAVTGYANPTTDTFVKSVSAETNKNLVTTTVPNVTGNSSVTANKSTWTFTMGSGDASETLIIGGGNGSDVTATNTTLGTAITVATGATSTTGTGDAVVTGVTIGSSAAAITALGTPTTETVLTGVKVTAQPTVALGSNASTGTGRVQVATGISSATATGGAVSWNSKDEVTAMTGLGTASTANALNDSTSLTVNKGNS